MTRFEALHFLRAHHGTAFWCGTWLGGCGRQLSTRVGMERVPHFAHYPDPQGRLSSCHRSYNGRRSADHLFVNRDLDGWLRTQGRKPGAPVLHGDFESGGTCTCLQISLRGEEGLITVVFKGFDLADWRQREEARRSRTSWFNWLFGPGVVSPQALLERDGYCLHLRLDWTNGASDIEVGTRARRGPTEWVGLGDCTLTEHGISTPRAAEIRVDARTNRTVIDTAASTSRHEVPIAPGTTVPLGKLRRIILLIGREQGMAGEMERASLCARLAREIGREPPRLPPWLAAEVRRVLHIQPPAAPANTHTREIKPRKPKPPAMETRSASRPPAPLEITEFPPVARLVSLSSAFDGIAPAEELTGFLTQMGWPVRGDIQQMRWLSFATVHRSYLYESELSEILDHSVLHALEEVGKRHINMAAIDRYLATHQPKSSGQQSKEYTEYVRRVREVVAAQPVLMGAALLGKGEGAQNNERHSKAPAVVVGQIVGVTALLGGHQAVRRLIARAIADADASPVRPQRVIDWRTLLQHHTRPEELTWEQGRSGPDHDLTFTIRIRDNSGRTAMGTGTSKKAAHREAAEDYLRRYMPRVWSAERSSRPSASRTAPPVPRAYARVPRDHRDVVDELMRLFELPNDAGPYIAQSLTHRSWIHENQREVEVARQRDNSLLAHHGAVVADLLMTHHRVRSVLSRTTTPEPGEITTPTPDESIWRDLFARMLLGRGLLLSSGQRVDPEPAYANAMQAVLATAWRAHGARLLHRRPTVLDEWIQSHGPKQDSATLLQRVCTIFNIQLAFSLQERGRDHQLEYMATISLWDATSRASLAGNWGHGGKTAAKKRAAARALKVLQQITHSERWDLRSDEKAFAAFLLQAQIRNAELIRYRDLPWCTLQGHLGTSFVLAHDRDGYNAWARQAEDLIRDRPNESDARLSEFYSRCVETAH
jgi:dsRNA-specific ribonuclease